MEDKNLQKIKINQLEILRLAECKEKNHNATRVYQFVCENCDSPFCYVLPIYILQYI